MEHEYEYLRRATIAWMKKRYDEPDWIQIHIDDVMGALSMGPEPGDLYANPGLYLNAWSLAQVRRRGRLEPGDV